MNNGVVSDARQCPSPNFDARPDDAGIDLLVIHGISLPPGEFGGADIEAFFTNQLDPAAHPYFESIHNLRVSSHLLVHRDGALTQFVNLQDRAWHAGRSEFKGRTNCNDFSIGVELEGVDDRPYAEAQYHRLVDLTRAIMNAYPAIRPERICGHSDIAPGRKTDPGAAFDWAKYKGALADGVTNHD